MDWLNEGVKKLGFVLTREQEDQFCRYRDELLAWNDRVNLTSITSPRDIERLHFLDSLTVTLGFPRLLPDGYMVCDVGSGAGFPGIPNKILFPGIGLTLVDATSKRTKFLQHMIEVLDLKGVDVYAGRAEDLGHDPALRESFNLVVSRAVATLSVLAEYTLPFCRLGGHVILQKKGDINKEMAEASRVWNALGGNLVNVKSVPIDVLEGGRVLVVIEKVSSTQDKYPRRNGIPAKRPL
jgi:16S rRNA (guanine527-N7)-methyltransferase